MKFCVFDLKLGNKLYLHNIFYKQLLILGIENLLKVDGES